MMAVFMVVIFLFLPFLVGFAYDGSTFCLMGAKLAVTVSAEIGMVSFLN